MNKLCFESKSHVLLFLVGLFWAITFSLLSYFHLSHQSEFYIVWAVLLGVSCILSDNGQYRLRLIVSAILLSGLIALMWHGSLAITKNTLEGSCLLIISFYALLCLQQVYHQTNRFRVDYELYFQVVWNNLPVMMIAIIFIGLVWGILELWVALFSLVGVEVFAHFFSNSYFIIVVTSFLAVIGAGIAYRSEKLLATGCNFFLLICKLVFPLLMVVLLLCLIPIGLSLISPLKDSDQYWLTASIEWLCLFSLIFFNGAYQSDQSIAKLSRWYRLLLQGYPILALLAALYLIYRIFHSGHFNATDTYCLIVSILFALYAIGYMRLRIVGGTNVILAYVVIGLMIALNNPITQKNLHIQVTAAQRYLTPAQSVVYQINKAGLVWSSSHHMAVSVRPVIVAEQDAPIGICRASCGHQELMIGPYQHNRCLIMCGTQMQQPQQFDVLMQDPNASISWGSYLRLVNDSHYPVRIQASDPNQVICRGILNNKIQLGIQSDSFKCMSVDSETGAHQESDTYQLLWVTRPNQY